MKHLNFERCLRHVWLLLAFIFVQQPLLGELPTHRYSFNGSANDSIGSAHGTLLGNAFIADNRLVLDGTNGRVQLPGNMFTNSKSLSFEIWFRNEQSAAPHGLWSFTGTPNIYFMFRESTGPMSFSRCYYGSLTVNAMLPMSPIANSREHHLVWAQDQASKLARVYLNGQLYAENTNFTAVPGPTTTGYLGSQGLGVPMLGTIAEFRTYSNALSHLEVVRSRAAGPDILAGSSAIVTNVQLRLSPHLGLGSLARPAILADFANQPAVDITPLTGIIFTSSDTNVLAPSGEGYLKAVGLGIAEITASYEGVSNTLALHVVAPGQFSLAHRYDFGRGSSNSNVVDLAGGADGRFLGGGTFTNGTQLYLNGGSSGYVDLPDGLVSSLDTITIEAWVTRYLSQSLEWWPRVFDFGSRNTNNSSGLNYIFLSSAITGTSPPGVIRFAANQGAGEVLQLTATPAQGAGAETHFAVVYDPASNVSKLYTNGTLAMVGAAPVPLHTLNDTNNWLGKSQFAGDANFHGVFNEFRIYRNALSDADIAASYRLGPDAIGADFMLHPQIVDTNLTISWGPSAGWLQLESCPTPETPTSWASLAVSPVFSNGSYQVTVPLTNESRFFRLAAP